jgi:hypothetical protein
MKIEEEETIVINRSGRSTYLDEKSVLRNGATPVITVARAAPSCVIKKNQSISARAVHTTPSTTNDVNTRGDGTLAGADQTAPGRSTTVATERLAATAPSSSTP